MSEPAGLGLSAAQQREFEADGVVVIPDVFSARECAGLRARMDELLADVAPESIRSVFSTTDRFHADDQYFLSSGDAIRPFLEDGAIGPDGTLQVPLDRAVNKVGHALHDLDPTFSAFSRHPRLAAIAADLGIAEPKLLQSMYIFKQPGIGGEVTWHTDHTFLWTDPPSVVGFWVALEEATEENGCLWCLPGGHRQPVKERFRRTEGNASTAPTTTEILDDSPYDTTAARPLPAAAGTLVVLHGALPHWSAPNTSDRSRHAYTLHVIDGAADYPSDNWLQRPSLPLRGF